MKLNKNPNRTLHPFQIRSRSSCTPQFQMITNKAKDKEKESETHTHTKR